MGRFNKIINKLVDKASDSIGMSKEAAEKILSQFDTVEKATALQGPKKAEYLKALDTIYGDSSKRADDLGFGKRDWYHGSTVDIPEFKKEAKGLSTGAQSAKKGFFFASDPSTASDYAELAAEKGVIREGDDVTTKLLSDSPDDGETQLLADSVDLSFERDNTLGKIQRQLDSDNNTKSILQRILKTGENPERVKDLQSKLEKSEKNINNWRQEIDDSSKKLANIKDKTESKGQQVGSYRLKGSPENIHVKDYKDEGYRDTTYSEEMSKAQKTGKSGVLFKNTYDPANPDNRVKQDIAAVFDPNQIRSTNAAFDPRFKDSSNILASMAPYVVGAGAVGAATFGGNSEAEASGIGRFKQIAKMLNIPEATVASMSPDDISRLLTRSDAEIIADSKQVGKTVHVVPSKEERTAMQFMADDLPKASSIKRTSALAPAMGLGDQIKTFKDEVAVPVVDKWEKFKSSIYAPLSKQMNITRDPENDKMIEEALSTIADPTNLLSGGAGLGLAGLQMLGQKDEEKDKQK